MGVIRYILLDILTMQTCRADEYEAFAEDNWQEAKSLLTNPEQPFFKRVHAIDSIEGEARYDVTGLAFSVLLGLSAMPPGPDKPQPPDLAKPVLSKVLQTKYGWQVVSKRIVPAGQPTQAEIFPVPEAAAPEAAAE